MVKFLIATHGYLANGFKSTLGIIMGKDIAENIETLNLFVDDDPASDDAKTRIKDYFQNVKADEQVIVFTDILHGSVNQFIMPYVNDKTVFILTGINLPMLCELMAMYGFSKRIVKLDDLQEVVIKAQKELLLVNDFVKETMPEQTEDDFFNDDEEDE